MGTPHLDAVLAEFASLPPVPRCCLVAEAAAVLRVSGPTVMHPSQVELAVKRASRAQGPRAMTVIGAAAGFMPQASGIRDRARFRLEGGPESENLIRMCGLAGQPLLGLPGQVLVGRRCDWTAAWRGAILAGGYLSDPARHVTDLLAVQCPSREVAIALAGLARRLGVDAEVRQGKYGAVKVAVTGEESITAMLSQIGAPAAAARWKSEQERMEKIRAALGSSCGRPAPLGTANSKRARKAASTGAIRARRALEILGGQAPPEITAAGRLRADHPEATLTALGEMADPPVNKNTIAGRLRRLSAAADRQAARLGIPGTGQMQIQAGAAASGTTATEKASPS